MATEGTADRGEQVQNLVSRELVPTAMVEPSPPQDMSDDEREALRRRAQELVAELAGAAGGKEMELLDSMTHVGANVQRASGAELNLLRTRVGDMMSGDGSGNEISGNLADLRVTIDQINPHELNKPGALRNLISVLPMVERLTPALHVIQKIAIRYEPVSRQITVTETKLREGRMMLTRDNVELRQLYEQVEAQQLPIQKNAYLGELLMTELQKLLESTDDPRKAERVRNALHDVSMSVQGLRTMEQVYAQFFVSIDMTRQNNNRLGQAVERTLNVATNVVMVGLAIQTALSREKKIMEVNARTREFIGNLLTANAAAIKQHTEDIGEVYNDPVIAIDKITQAHGDLIAAMDTADRLKREGIDSARKNIAELNRMSTQLRERAGTLRDPDAEGPRAIEA
jgi:uncharacterized protein YaaN involved in tellurite resistance